MFRLRLFGVVIATMAAFVVVSAGPGLGLDGVDGTGYCKKVGTKTICRGAVSDTGNPSPRPTDSPGVHGATYNAPSGPGSGSVGGPSRPRPLSPTQLVLNQLSPCSGNSGLFCLDLGSGIGMSINPFTGLPDLAVLQGGVPAAAGTPVRPGAPGGPARIPPPSPAQVAHMAQAQLTIPKPDIGSAPCTAADCKGAVGVPVWLWTDPGMFTPITETATVGPVSVTVTAVPTGVKWDMGDGQTVTCDGPGTKYDVDEFGWADSPDCGYQYTQTSTDQPGGRYPLTATATWAVTFSGDFTGTDTVSTTSTTNVAIGEYQAIVTKSG